MPLPSEGAQCFCFFIRRDVIVSKDICGGLDADLSSEKLLL